MNNLGKILISIISFVAIAQADCFRDNLANSYQIPYRYEPTPDPLVEVLRNSYIERTSKNKYLDNAFWGSNSQDRCSWPKSLWLALDNVDLNSLYTLVSVYQRAEKTDLWKIVKYIKNIWMRTSQGFAFDSDYSVKELDELFKTHKKFCRDWEISTTRYHKGQTCWREISKDRAGLHFCYSDNGKFDVHIDYNQPAFGRLPLSDSCSFHPAGLIRHYQDLNGPAPKTMLNYLSELKEDIEKLLQRSIDVCGENDFLFQTSLKNLLKQLDRQELIRIALKGSEANQAGEKLLQSIQNEREQILSVFSQCHKVPHSFTY